MSPQTHEEREYARLVEDIATLDPVSWEHYEHLMEALLDRSAHTPEDVAVRSIALAQLNSALAEVVQRIVDPDKGLDLTEFNLDVVGKRESYPGSSLESTLYTRATIRSPLSIPEPQG